MKSLGALIVAAGIGLGAATTPSQAQDARFGLWFGTPGPFYEPYYAPPPPRWYGYRYYEPRRYHGRYYEPRYRPRGGWAAHVAWCHDRFRSYNESRDAFKGYDGRWHKCNSPSG